jgi:TetR/AcrR family transcriptional regulator, regulator of cefoperazone and chloramphenicol sensitivity
MVYMRSTPPGGLPDDRTARARIRDEALRLFSERGPDAVTVRDIAAAAGVSPALVVRHFDGKDGLRAAVDEYVSAAFAAMLDEALDPPGAASLDPAAVPTMAEVVAGGLPAGSPIPAYLGRMLVGGGPAGAALFGRLYEVSRTALAGLAAAGAANEGADPAVRAAFLLVNDLAVLMLRDHLTAALGVDPLSPAGLRRWGAEILAIYRDGLGPSSPGTSSAGTEEDR